MKKVIVLVLMVVVGVGIGIWWFYFRPAETVDNKIFVSGNVEAEEIDLSFRIAGQIQKISVEEGDRVTAGQVIACLDTDTLQALKKAAEAEIAVARAVLDELETGTRIEQIEIAKAALKAAQSRLRVAKAEHDRYEPLFKQGAISASAFDAKEMALKVALEDHRSAAERLRELKIGPRQEQIRAAAAKLDRAKWELKKIELDLEHSELIAPRNGVVLVKSNYEGEVVLPGATVLTMACINEVWLKGYVGEEYLGRVKLGQNVEVVTDSYPNKKYPGKVTYVSSRAEFTPKNVQTREERVKQVYRVKVTIPNPKQELKIGMPAEGYILTDESLSDVASDFHKTN